MRSESLAEALFSMEEPWQSRFLILVAEMATNWTWNGRVPSRGEIAAWLSDPGVRREVTLMLRAWQNPCE
jgi:hypothetical protein